MKNLHLLKKDGPNYYIVDGCRMTKNSINTLLLCEELSNKNIKWSSCDFRVIDLYKRRLIDTKVIKQQVITFITVKGYMKLIYLHNLGIERL